MDLGFGTDADCAGTLDPSEVAHSPYGLMLSRGEARARFDLHLQQSSKVVPGPSALSNNDINRVAWPILTEQNPSNPNHKWAWDMAGSPNVCGAFQNEPCCTDPMTNAPVSCSDGMNVRTTIHANQLLGFAPSVLVSLMDPGIAGIARPNSGFTWQTDSAVDYKVYFQVSECATCTYSWTLGDGGTADSSTFSHVYANNSSRTVSLSIFDTASGMSRSTSHSVTPVYVAATPMSLSGVNMTPSGYSPTVNWSIGGGVAPYTISTNWGDGLNSSTSQASAGAGSASHTYVSSGTYTVTITAKDSGVGGINITTAKATINVTLAPVSASGLVTTSTGTPLSGVSLSLQTGGVTKKMATSLTNGTYSFPNVAPGNYTVTATKSGYTFASPAASVSVSGSGDVTITTIAANSPAAAVNVTGLVTSSTGTALSGVSMSLKLGGVTKYLAVTNASGIYTFGNVANGTYTITATKGGYTFASPAASVTVSGSTVTQNISAITP
jgi:hypothetical protein